MENFEEWDHTKLKNELLKGKELAKQLQIHLNVRSSSLAASSFSNELLVQKILCSYEKVLSLLNPNGIQQIIYESPSSLNGGSPRSEDDSLDQTNPNSFRKRNILPTWTHKFQVSPGMALKGSLDDGFCWRKYGQKGILGAKHPRGYYRCTHRNLQGCIATKQVQPSDDDSNVFEITYRGTHSCSQVSNLSTTTPSTTTQEFQQQNQADQKNVQNQQQIISPDVLLDSWANSLRVITDQNLDTTHKQPTLLSFHHLTYTSNYETRNRVEPASTSSNVVAEISPSDSSFLSPTTSGSGMSNLEANKCEIFTSPIINSTALNSQITTTALDFPFDEFQIDPTFTFNNTNFFS